MELCTDCKYKIQKFRLYSCRTNDNFRIPNYSVQDTNMIIIQPHIFTSKFGSDFYICQNCFNIILSLISEYKKKEGTKKVI